jgi:hypothetical protein
MPFKERERIKYIYDLLSNDTGTFTVLHEKLSKGAMSILRNGMQEGCLAHSLDY